MTPIDITEPTAEICRRLHFKPSDVLSLTWTPSRIVAVICLKNGDGKHYIDPDTNEVASEKRVWEIRA